MIDKIVPGFSDADRILSTLAPSGYVIAFNVIGINPAMSRTTYSEEWHRLYQSQSFGVLDPTVHWGIANTGIVRWSEIADEYYVSDRSKEFMETAADYGLKYGVTYTSMSSPVTADEPAKKSFCAAARTSAEFDHDEIMILEKTFTDVLDSLLRIDSVTEDEIKVLDLLSAGFSHKEIAQRLLIPKTTVRSRLNSSRNKLGAQNNTETVMVAQQMRILNINNALTW